MLLRFFRALSVGDSAKQTSFDQKQLLVMHLVMLNRELLLPNAWPPLPVGRALFPKFLLLAVGFQVFLSLP